MSLDFLCMAENELHNGCRVFQAVRMMIAIRFDDDLNLAAEFLVAFLDKPCVFRHRHRLVGVAANAQDWNHRFRQRREVVHRIERVTHRLFFGQAIG